MLKTLVHGSYLKDIVTTDNGKYQDGDVIIWQAIREHTNGHIQIHYNGSWYSDHLQNNKNPWSDRKPMDKYTFYR